MLGQILVTKQTGAQGKVVSKVWIDYLLFLYLIALNTFSWMAGVVTHRSILSTWADRYLIHAEFHL